MKAFTHRVFQARSVGDWEELAEAEARQPLNVGVKGHKLQLGPARKLANRPCLMKRIRSWSGASPATPWRESKKSGVPVKSHRSPW